MNKKILLAAFLILSGTILSLTFLSFASDIFSDEAESYRILGYQYHRQGNIDKAITYYKKAIELNPEYPTAYNDLGIAYEQQGKLAKAEENYLKALQLDPHYLRAHTNLGFLYDRMGEYEKAIYHLEKRIEKGYYCDAWTKKVKRKLVELRKKLAGIIAEEITKEKEKEAKENTGKANLLVKEGQRLYNKNDYEGAFKTFEEALRLDPNNKDAKEFLKKTEEQVKRGEFDERVKLEPIKIYKPKKEKKIEIPRKEMPKVQRKIPEKKEAITKVDKKFESDRDKKRKDLAKDHLRLGKLFYKYGQYEKSLEQLNQCLELDPQNKEAKKLIKKAQKELAKQRPKEETKQQPKEKPKISKKEELKEKEKSRAEKREERKQLKAKKREEKKKAEKERKVKIAKKEETETKKPETELIREAKEIAKMEAAERKQKQQAEEKTKNWQLLEEKRKATLAKLRYEKQKQKCEAEQRQDRLKAEQLALRKLILERQEMTRPKEPEKKKTSAGWRAKGDTRPLYLIIREHYTKAIEFFEAGKFDESLGELKFLLKLNLGDEPDLKDMLKKKKTQVEEKKSIFSN